jgi:hypothetical protein
MMTYRFRKDSDMTVDGMVKMLYETLGLAIHTVVEIEGDYILYLKEPEPDYISIDQKECDCDE